MSEVTARISGNIPFGSVLEISAGRPLDARNLVDTYDQIFASGSYGGSKGAAYKGMIIGVADTGKVYIVTAVNPTSGAVTSATLVGETDGHISDLTAVKLVIDALKDNASGKASYVINKEIVGNDNAWEKTTYGLKLPQVLDKVGGENGLVRNSAGIEIPYVTPATTTESDNGKPGVISGLDAKKISTMWSDKPEPISSAALDLLLIETEAEEEVITPTVHTTSTATPTEATGGYYTFAVKSKTGNNAPSYSNPFTASSEPAIGDIIRTSANGNSAYEFVVVEVYEMSPAENVTATIAKTVRRSSTASGS